MPTFQDKEILNARVVNAYGTAEEWTAANPVLMEGEIGIEQDSRKHKVGDGVTAWNDLQYAGVAMEDIVYSNSDPIINGIGGIEAGETFDNVQITDMLTKLLYPYTPQLTRLTAAPTGGTFEVGATVEAPLLTATVTKKSNPIVNVQFYQGGALIHEVTENVANGGNFTHQLADPVTSNTEFTAKSSDGKTIVTSSAKVNYNFVRPAYIGKVPSDAAVPTSAQITAMVKKVQNPANLTNTISYNVERMCVACPPGWTISKIIDPNNFDVTASFTHHIIAVDCLDGTQQNYNVYVSEPTTQTNFKMTYNR